MCLVIVRELIRSGRLKEVWDAWPVLLASVAAVGLVVFYALRTGKSLDKPYQFDFAIVIALLVIAVAVALVYVLLGALGLFPGI